MLPPSHPHALKRVAFFFFLFSSFFLSPPIPRVRVHAHLARTCLSFPAQDTALIKTELNRIKMDKKQGAVLNDNYERRTGKYNEARYSIPKPAKEHRYVKALPRHLLFGLCCRALVGVVRNLPAVSVVGGTNRPPTPLLAVLVCRVSFQKTAFLLLLLIPCSCCAVFVMPRGSTGTTWKHGSKLWITQPHKWSTNVTVPGLSN